MDQARHSIVRRLPIHTLFSDLRYGSRMLLKRPAFSLIVVVLFALGIGANTAMFSVVNAVLLRPLEFKDPGRIVSVSGPDPLIFSFKPTFRIQLADWVKGMSTLDDVTVYMSGKANWSGRNEPRSIPAAEVSEDFFGLLGVEPIRGRTFSTGEQGKPDIGVALLSNKLWVQDYDSSPDIIGQPIRLNGKPFTVIGVMPARFNFPDSAEVWTPIPLEAANDIFGGNIIIPNVIARLKPSATLAQAQAECKSIAQQNPMTASNADQTRVITLRSSMVPPDWRSGLLYLLGAVGCVLLISCADVAGLMLAHGAARSREIAVRAALGASRGRLLRQFLTESLLLSALGGTAGFLVGWWTLGLARILIPSGVPFAGQIDVDWRVLFFTLTVALATGIVSGIIPALRFARTNVIDGLKEGSEASGSIGSGLHRLRGAFGVFEVAMALVLLTGAGLFVRSLGRLMDVKPGFRTDHLLTANLSLLGPGYAGKEGARSSFCKSLLSRAGSLPGVQEAALVNPLPLSNIETGVEMLIETRQPTSSSDQRGVAAAFQVTPDYFRALGVPLIAGRYLSESDSDGKSRAVVVSRGFVSKYWPNQNPVGKQLRYRGQNDSWFNVVGEVGSVRSWALSSEAVPQMYLPFSYDYQSSFALVIHTSENPDSLASSVREAVHEIDKDLPISSIATMDQLKYGSASTSRFETILLGVFAMLALVLAIVGIYGIVSYSVSQRTREIGLRIALGAEQADVLRMILRQGLVMTIIGIGLGITASLALSRLVSSMLYGVRPTDPLTFCGAAALLVGAALLASYIPARRAARVDPMVALRQE